MKFKELDTKMRVFEEADDYCVLPGMHIVIRLDGRGFTRLTKETLALEKPFDIRMRVAMGLTAQHVMDCGFRTLYAYTQSDEISMLLHPEDVTYDHKTRKLLSILAGEASAAFTRHLALEMGTDYDGITTCSFDARLSQLPTEQNVIDYFRWRQADAKRNARNSHVYWMLRSHGHSPKKADTLAASMDFTEKVQFLLDNGIDVDKLPDWQTHGTGLWWEEFTKEGTDPRTGEKKLARRRRVTLGALPDGDAYGTFIRDLLVQD
jgi:tRNA(His) 5'-end guanylyltransferase